MNKIASNMIFGAMLLLLAACTGDELTDSAMRDLPEGKYPLGISSVTMIAASAARPGSTAAPRTKMVENTDGSQSQWQTDDEIRVGIEGQDDSGNYKLTVAEDGTVTAVTPSAAPVYWKKQAPRKVRARYPADGAVALDNQTPATGLAYALFAETATAVDYTADITLPFQHQLAKIRVVPGGNMKGDVTAVHIKTYQSCILNEDGTLSTATAAEGFIPLIPATRNGAPCWEANVVPGYEIREVKVTSNSGATSQFDLSTPVTPVAGNCHEVTVSVDKLIVLDLTSVEGDTYTVDDNVSIVIDGKGQPLNKKLVIGTGASVVLRNVMLNNTLSGDAIEVNGTATLILSGTNQLESSSQCPLVVAVESTLTINGTDNDQLTLIGKARDYGTLGLKTGANLIINGGHIIADGSKTKDSGIGSYGGGSTGDACGTITINGGIIEATGGESAAGIGSGVDNKCGNISITGGNITATGGEDVDAYGAGIGSGRGGTCGNITISGENTVVTATAGGADCDDIGKGTDGTCGTVTITEASVTATHNKIHGQ